MKTSKIRVAGHHPTVIFRNILNRGFFRSPFVSREIVTTRLNANLIIATWADDQAAASLMFQGGYAPFQTSVFVRLLGGVDRFIDVGANYGYFSLLASQHFADTAKAGEVHVIEPNPKLMDTIAESYRISAQDYPIFHQVAASDRVSDAFLNVQESRSGHSSLDTYGLPVGTSNLDSLVPPSHAATLVKIDVEGEETNVLKGARALLETGAVWMVEVRPDTLPAVRELASQYGYELYSLQGEELLGQRDMSTSQDIILSRNGAQWLDSRV